MGDHHHQRQGPASHGQGTASRGFAFASISHQKPFDMASAARNPDPLHTQDSSLHPLRTEPSFGAMHPDPMISDQLGGSKADPRADPRADAMALDSMALDPMALDPMALDPMALDPLPMDLSPLPEDFGFPMQNMPASFDEVPASNLETSPPNSHTEPIGGLMPSNRDTIPDMNGPQMHRRPSCAGPSVQPSFSGTFRNLDGQPDVKDAAIAYESVFPPDDAAMPLTWNMPGSFKALSGTDPAVGVPPCIKEPHGTTSVQFSSAQHDLDSPLAGYQSHSDPSGGKNWPSTPRPSHLAHADLPDQHHLDPNQYANPPYAHRPRPECSLSEHALYESLGSFDPDISSLALDPPYIDGTPGFTRSLSHSMAESPLSADRSPQPSASSSYVFPGGATETDACTEKAGVQHPGLAPSSVPLYDEPGGVGASSAACHEPGSNRTSISFAANELSPLTTTTSFSASLSSYHSTQQSFFSAQQYWRSSLEHPPSSIHRASFDLYQRRRGSLESSNSGANASARSQRSLASYIPFMDRDRKSPTSNPSPPSEWQSPMAAAPRHSIRSIFKTSNAPQAVAEEPERAAKTDLDHMDGEDAQKKAKRTTRGLFKRFKQTKQEDMKQEMKQEEARQGEIKHGEIKQGEIKHEEMIQGDMNQGDMKQVDIKQEEIHEIGSMSSHHSDGHSGLSSGHGDAESADAPDYGALFSKVGKRKSFGMKNSKKERDRAKNEPARGEARDHPKNEAVKLEDSRSVSSTENSDTSHLSATTSSGAAPVRENNEGGAASSFASASKRILGSRLMKKKNLVKNEPLTNVVEIDLHSLDLPENTEVIEKHVSETRTRGRKEDKAADLEDDSKIFICEYCTRRFKRQEHLKRHFRSLHTAEKPYNCSYCSKKFSRTDNLNQHEKVHREGGIKPGPAECG